MGHRPLKKVNLYFIFSEKLIFRAQKVCHFLIRGTVNRPEKRVSAENGKVTRSREKIGN